MPKIVRSIKEAIDELAEMLKEETRFMGSRVSIHVSNDIQGLKEMQAVCGRCGRSVKVFRKNLPDGTYSLHTLGFHGHDCSDLDNL